MIAKICTSGFATSLVYHSRVVHVCVHVDVSVCMCTRPAYWSGHATCPLLLARERGQKRAGWFTTANVVVDAVIVVWHCRKYTKLPETCTLQLLS